MCWPGEALSAHILAGAHIIKTMTDWYLISVVIFACILALLFWRDRKNVKRESVILLRKTQRGKRLLVKAGRAFPNLWKGLGMFAVLVGFCVSVFFMTYLAQNAYLMATVEEAPMPTVGFLLPSPTAEPILLPGVIAAPFWYWIIAIAMLVVFHEGMHGIMAAREKLRIKSMGWGLLLIIPLAFVEPDEKELRKRPAWQQLRVFAAGSFGNFILAGICLLVLYMFMVALYVPGGVYFSGYIEDYPAEQANLTGIITAIGGYEVRSLTALSNALEEIGPGKEVTVRSRLYYRNYTFEDKEYVLTTVSDNETGRGFIGITFNPATVNFFHLADNWWAWRYQIKFLEGLFQWMFLINLGVGAVNLLPIGPLDGGRMWQLVFKKISKKQWKRASRALTYITLAVLGSNFAIPILRSLAGV